VTVVLQLAGRPGKVEGFGIADFYPGIFPTESLLIKDETGSDPLVLIMLLNLSSCSFIFIKYRIGYTL
jgi:hypothetical protein